MSSYRFRDLNFAVQSLSHVWLFVTPWTEAHQASLSFTISRRFLKLTTLSWWCHPTISTSIIPISSCTQFFPSIKVFSNELALCIRWPRYWSFSFSISPSKEYSELISFRIDWFDILAVQGSLKSLLQHHSSKASIFNGPSLWSNSHIHTWLLEKL